MQSLLGSKCFIIAEIGQNHNGCLKTAKRLITEAASAGVDCVKFQKSNLAAKFTTAALNRPYDSENSFGATYGDHKRHLEFSIPQFQELKRYAEELGVIFSASAMDEPSYWDLVSLGLQFIKIGSGDNSNYLMLEKIAASEGPPLIISTGMQTTEGIARIMKIMAGKEVALLHCISSYPTPASEVRLRYLETLKGSFNCPVGYSGHEEGTTISLAAVALGARIIERHFTLDKSAKGSDHCCSLTPTEMGALVGEIRLLESALGEVGPRRVFDCEKACFFKLGKSLVFARDLPAGHRLVKDDFRIKVSEPSGLLPEQLDALLGKVLVCGVLADEPILFQKMSTF